REQLKAELQVVAPGSFQTPSPRTWQFALGPTAKSLRGKPLYLRIKFNAADKTSSGTFYGLWGIGVPQKTPLWASDTMSLAPDTFHEFEIPADLFDADGVLTVTFFNPNKIALLFPLEDGMELLYPQGSFGLNYARGLGIIFCWMALFAAMGLA